MFKRQLLFSFILTFCFVGLLITGLLYPQKLNRFCPEGSQAVRVETPLPQQAATGLRLSCQNELGQEVKDLTTPFVFSLLGIFLLGLFGSVSMVLLRVFRLQNQILKP